MKTIASIEARMGSSRLPGKVMMDIAGRPAIERLVQRLEACQKLDGIVLATTSNQEDEPLVSWAQEYGLPVFRGSEQDVLERVVGAQRLMAADTVVEVTGDCPLLDPEIIDWGIAMYAQNACDLVSNTWKPAFPMGVDVQVFALSQLEEVAATVSDPAVREHVSLYFYEHPERYRILHLAAPPELNFPDYRFQLDYREDLAFVRRLYTELEPLHGPVFSTRQILAHLQRYPEILELNRHCEEKTVR
jgi:spore coat polysaccharide biosynthesis protein SpsF